MLLQAKPFAIPFLILVHSTHIYLPMKMEQTECSETSAYKLQTPGNYPKESIQHTERGKSLKSRIYFYVLFSTNSCSKYHLFQETKMNPQTYKVQLNTFTAIVDLSRFNNSCLKSPVSTLVDLTFQSRALRSFSLNQLRNLSL